MTETDIFKLLFGQTESAAGESLRPEAIDVSGPALSLAAGVLSELECAIGTTDDRIYSALRYLAATGGAQEPEELLATGTVTAIHRPWRWLAAVATHAESIGGDVLAARVFVFTVWWMDMWASAVKQAQEEGEATHLRLYFETLLTGAPDEARAQIGTAAIASLSRIPPQRTIVTLAGQDVRAGAMLPDCAQHLLGLHRSGEFVRADTLKTAREVASN